MTPEDRNTLSAARGFTGVTEKLTARHVDPLGLEGEHPHTWFVTTFYPVEPRRDGRALKAALRMFLDALPEVLPAELWAGEDIARACFVLEGVVRVRVTRPEGYEAVVWA